MCKFILLGTSFTDDFFFLRPGPSDVCHEVPRRLEPVLHAETGLFRPPKHKGPL